MSSEASARLLDAARIGIRRATSADGEAVAELLLASRRAHLPYAPLRHADAEVRRWVADVLLSEERVWLACDDAGLHGMAALRTEPGLHWLTQLYLRPGRTGRGIGTRLLDEALRGCSGPVRLHCFQRNHGARAFYERHGFRAIALGDGSDNEEGCPDVLYQRELPL